MRSGTLEWGEIIVRDVEIEELWSVIEHIIKNKDDANDIVISTEIGGTYAVSYKTVIKPWENVLDKDCPWR